MFTLNLKRSHYSTGGETAAMFAVFGGCCLMMLVYAAALPLALLWAINVLGIAVIEITWKSWLAAFVLLTVLRGIFGSNNAGK